MMLFLLLAVHFNATSQSSPSVLEQRLCRTWHFDRIVQGAKESVADRSLSDFVIIIQADHSVKQGMNPDGLINGEWSVNEKEMLLTIRDESTAEVYEMKIVSLSADELILQDPKASSSVMLHYRAK